MKFEINPAEIKLIAAMPEEQAALNEVIDDCVAAGIYPKTIPAEGFCTVVIPINQPEIKDVPVFETGDKVVVLDDITYCSKLYHGHTGMVVREKDDNERIGIPVYLDVDDGDPKRNRFVFHPNVLRKI